MKTLQLVFEDGACSFYVGWANMNYNL